MRDEQYIRISNLDQLTKGITQQNKSGYLTVRQYCTNIINNVCAVKDKQFIKKPRKK